MHSSLGRKLCQVLRQVPFIFHITWEERKGGEGRIVKHLSHARESRYARLEVEVMVKELEAAKERGGLSEMEASVHRRHCRKKWWEDVGIGF